MAIGTWFGQGGAITLSIGGTAYTDNIVAAREVTEESGGDSFTTADGTTHRTAKRSSVVALQVGVVQSLTSTNLWRYLRETTPTTVEIRITGTSSATEGASNPEWVYSATSWTVPPLDWTAGSGAAFPVAEFTVSNPTVDTTP